jgi:hypothetical protein
VGSAGSEFYCGLRKLVNACALGVSKGVCVNLLASPLPCGVSLNTVIALRVCLWDPLDLTGLAFCALLVSDGSRWCVSEVWEVFWLILIVCLLWVVIGPFKGSLTWFAFLGHFAGPLPLGPCCSLFRGHCHKEHWKGVGVTLICGA